MAGACTLGSIRPRSSMARPHTSLALFLAATGLVSGMAAGCGRAPGAGVHHNEGGEGGEG